MEHTAIKSFIFKTLAVLLVGFLIRPVYAQHYRSAYYSSGWTSANSAQSSRVATLPSYGKQAVKQREFQQRRPQPTRGYGYRQQNNQAFDTLADTGLYMGLSLGKSLAITGQMTSVYCDPTVPGNCTDGQGNQQDATSMGLTFGVAVTSTTRLELNYTKYSDMKYGDTAAHNDGFGTRDLRVDGGEIESNLLMASFYYSLEEMFGNFSGGQLIPYFGFGVGLAFNTVNEYTIYDPDGYVDQNACINYDAYEYDSNSGTWILGNDFCDSYFEGQTSYAGSSTQSLAWAAELGLTWKLQNRMFIDFFFKHTSLGEIKNSGMVVNDYLLEHYYIDGLLVDDNTAEFGIDDNGVGGLQDSGTSDSAVYLEESQIVEAFYDGVEKADYTISEFGVKFRIMF
ncbi:MAG: hypothetical protein JW812_02100 [Alphaproteobacteria bacterium]|nr:hypothetical protein [Alphaproteobacteria bacterium]